MKSMPLTMRGPVDDENFTWVKSHPRLYASQGELGLRTLAQPSHKVSSRQRSRTTGSAQLTSSNMESRDGRGATILPKIATGRSAQSAKKLYKDYETIKIRARIQNELETPRIPPLYVPKNPKPLYKRPVDEMKHFNVLHLREFAERGEVDPEAITDSSQEFYARITFLRNAVRNTDGTTSYQNLCKRPRSWSVPTPMDDERGLIKGNRLHWQSASSAMKHPRMLLPLKPGPSTKWYAWKVDQLRRDKKGNNTKPANTEDPFRREFLQVFSPRDPHPTPAGFKDGPGHGALRSDGEEKQRLIEPRGVTFITEDKEDEPTTEERDVLESEKIRGQGETATEGLTKDGDQSGEENQPKGETELHLEEGTQEPEQRSSEDKDHPEQMATEGGEQNSEQLESKELDTTDSKQKDDAIIEIMVEVNSVKGETEDNDGIAGDKENEPQPEATDAQATEDVDGKVDPSESHNANKTAESGGAGTETVAQSDQQEDTDTREHALGDQEISTDDNKANGPDNGVAEETLNTNSSPYPQGEETGNTTDKAEENAHAMVGVDGEGGDSDGNEQNVEVIDSADDVIQDDGTAGQDDGDVEPETAERGMEAGGELQEQVEE